MMPSLKRMFTLVLALCMVLTIAHPGAVIADDDWDDDDIWGVDDDDDDDDVPVAPAPPPAPAPPAGPVGDDDDDDGDWDDELGDYGLDDDDSPLASQAIVQLQPGVDADAFAARYGGRVLRGIPGPNVALITLGAGSGAGTASASVLQSSDDDDDLDDDGSDDNDDDRVTQPVMDDEFYARYAIGDDLRATMTAMVNDPDVIWVEFNFTSRAPEGRPRYFFTSMDGTAQPVDAPALPDGLEFDTALACATGSSVVVAVLDTGADPQHPALAGNLSPNGVNMLEVTTDVSDTGDGQDNDGDGEIDEMVGHGTHVSGTILQVAPNATILPIKVLDSDGSGDTFSVMAGIIYAIEQNVDVINLSLGTTWHSAAIEYAVGAARDQGIVVIAAAGNGNRSAPVEYPASNEGVISVAATDDVADKAEYSNYNQHVDISAPGNNVASAYPGGAYTTASGTSMAAPIVSGSVALMLERSPETSPQVVRDRVFQSASPLSLSDPGMDGMLGGGEIDIHATLVCDG